MAAGCESKELVIESGSRHELRSCNSISKKLMQSLEPIRRLFIKKPSILEVRKKKCPYC